MTPLKQPMCIPYRTLCGLQNVGNLMCVFGHRPPAEAIVKWPAVTAYLLQRTWQQLKENQF